MFYKFLLPITLIFTLTSCELLSNLKDDSSKDDEEKQERQSQNYGPGLIQSSNTGNKISFESKAEAEIKSVTATQLVLNSPYHNCDGSVTYEQDTLKYTIAANRLILDEGDCDGIILKGSHSSIWGEWETTIAEMMLTENICAVRKTKMDDQDSDYWNDYPYEFYEEYYEEYYEYHDSNDEYYYEDDLDDELFDKIFKDGIIEGTMKVDFVQSKNIAVIKGRIDYCIAGMMEIFVDGAKSLLNHELIYLDDAQKVMAEQMLPSIVRGNNCNEMTLNINGNSIDLKYSQPFVSGPVQLKATMGSKTCERNDILKNTEWLEFIVMGDDECVDSEESEYDALNDCLEELTGTAPLMFKQSAALLKFAK